MLMDPRWHSVTEARPAWFDKAFQQSLNSAHCSIFPWLFADKTDRDEALEHLNQYLERGQPSTPNHKFRNPDFPVTIASFWLFFLMEFLNDDNKRVGSW